MKGVTAYLNEAHLENRSTIGDPANIRTYGNPLTPSINFSSAYAFRSLEDLGSYYGDVYNSVRYARDSSLLVRQLEQYFSLFHGGDRALLFNSGMAAISAALLTLVRRETTLVTFGSYYRKTFALIDGLCRHCGATHRHYRDLPAFDAAPPEGKNLLFFLETPSNPFLELLDVRQLRESHPAARIVVDATLQGLLNDKGTLALADLSIMSCTKYIGGHNDVLAGLVVCHNAEIYPEVWNERSMRGGIIDNMAAYLLFRSLRTYDLRIAKALENTDQVLAFLASSPQVMRVHYPGHFANAGQRELFERTHHHGGALVTFEVREDVPLEKNIGSVCSMKMAPSFGSVDTLIEIPAYMSHWGKSAAELEALGLSRRTVRLAVGMEPFEYIRNDLVRILGEAPSGAVA